MKKKFWEDLWNEISRSENGTFVGVFVDHNKKEFYIYSHPSPTTAYSKADDLIWSTTYPAEIRDIVNESYKDCKLPPAEILSYQLYELKNKIDELVEQGYTFGR